MLGEFSSFFLQALAEPSKDRPTVRCISEAEALRIALDARDTIKDPELRGYSAIALIELLSASGILQKLPLEPGAKPKTLYAVGLQPVGSINPVELLEACQPDGVVCYFSALEYYGLTTQTPTHYHIAKMVSATRQGRRSTSDLESAKPEPQKQVRSRLGALIFTYQGIPYYLTNRGSHTLAGVQLRRLNEKTIVRITTREQTLLDTLQRPISCGGISVMWEAWEQGLPDLDEKKLVEHLDKIGDPILTRRVGYVLSVNGYDPSALLEQMLSQARNNAARVPDRSVPALLPGFNGETIDRTWLLTLP